MTRMAELSNKMLAFLVIAAMVISVFGTIASLSKLGELSPLVTGASSTGIVNLTVEQLLSINFTFQNEAGAKVGAGNFSWGTGSVTGGASYANLSSRGTTDNWNGSSVTGSMNIENTGNRGVKLVISSANGSAATFAGGTAPIYRWNFSEQEVSSCLNTTNSEYNLNLTKLAGSFWENSTFNVNSSVTLCGNLTFQGAADEILMGIYIGLPSDSKTGDLIDVITATISEAT